MDGNTSATREVQRLDGRASGKHPLPEACSARNRVVQATAAGNTLICAGSPRRRLPLLAALVVMLSLSGALLPAAAIHAGEDGDEDSSAVERGERLGNTSNLVFVFNKKDNRTRLRASIELDRVPGDSARPANIAVARASCTDCQTFAIALQIALRDKNASTVAPENVAFAYNENCLRCYTVARAIQYVVPVDDPMQPPEDVQALLRDMEKELRDVIKGDFTLDEAEARINDVIARFRTLAEGMYDTRDERRQ